MFLWTQKNLSVALFFVLWFRPRRKQVFSDGFACFSLVDRQIMIEAYLTTEMSDKIILLICSNTVWSSYC